MWHIGRPAAEQCEGCTFNTSHITELSYLNSRDVSYAVFCEGPYEEASRYRDFMGYPVSWYSVPQDSVDRLIADRHFGILACYLRDGDQVYETYWTTGRGNEAMAPSYGLLHHPGHRLRHMSVAASAGPFHSSRSRGQPNSSMYSSGGPSSWRSRSSRASPRRCSSSTVTMFWPACSRGAGQYRVTCGPISR